MHVRKALVAVGLVAAVAGGVAACSAGRGGAARTTDESTGQVLAALSAVGPDGATYTLPSSAFLNVSWTGDGGSGASTLQFNNTPGTQSFSVAVGNYTATLFGATSLVRTGDAGTTTVSATLNDAQPYAFTVKGGQTTSLTFHFTVQGIGNLTFSTGTLGTNLQVDSGTTTPTRAIASGSASVISVTNGPPGLSSALSFMGTQPVSYSIAVTLTSPFQASVDSACANITTQVTTGMAMTPLQQNINAFMQEPSNGMTGSLCLFDANAASFPGQVVLFFYRFGPPTTPQMIAALGGVDGGVPNQTWQFQIQAQPPAPLYDGSTASLAQLSQPLTIPVVNFLVFYEPNNTFLSAQSPGTGTPGNLTLQLLP
jgi:hypothetical protein